MGFPGGSVGKESDYSAGDTGDTGSIPGLGRSPGEGKAYSFQYSGLENSMDCIVYGITKSQTWLSDFHFHFISPATHLRWRNIWKSICLRSISFKNCFFFYKEINASILHTHKWNRTKWLAYSKKNKNIFQLFLCRGHNCSKNNCAFI